MNFCPECGTNLTVLKTDSSWEAKYRCDSCGTRIQVNYGDAMGGASDSTYISKKPFDKEDVKK